MRFRTLEEAFRELYPQSGRTVSMDEAFRKITGDIAPRQQAQGMSLEEAFEKVTGNAAASPEQGTGESSVVEEKAGPLPLHEAWKRGVERNRQATIAAPEEESVSLSDRAVDYGRRALGGIDAGMANVAASMAHGGGWLWGEYSDLVNRGVNAASKALTGRNLVPEGPDAISQAALAVGDRLAQKGEEYSRFGLGDRQPGLYDAIMQGLGSTAAFMVPGAAVARGAGLGRIGSALAYGATKGGLESISEGGSVYRDLLKQGASLEEARSAARKDAIAQFPINVASDAVGDLMGGGGWLRGALGRGAGELVQETGQGVLSDTLSKRKADGKPVTWGDLARAVPEMAKAVPEAMWNEGVPAFISAALIGAGEGIYGNAMQRREAARQNAGAQAAAEIPAQTSPEMTPQESPVQAKPALEKKKVSMDEAFNEIMRRAQAQAHAAPVANIPPAAPVAQKMEPAKAQVAQPLVETAPATVPPVVSPQAPAAQVPMAKPPVAQAPVAPAPAPVHDEKYQGTANVPAAPVQADDTLRPVGTPPVPGNEARAEGGSPHAGVTAFSSMKLPDSDKVSASEGSLPPQGWVHQESIKPQKQTVNALQSPSRVAAEEVRSHLLNGGRFANNRALFDITDKAFGGTQAERKYGVKDAYDAMELGVNLTLSDEKYNPSKANSVVDVRSAVEEIDAKILSALPTQANRTAEQVEFQQFSTPPTLSYVANWLLRAGKGDTVLEPSAGTGGLAVFAKNAGAKVIANELSGRRAELLREMGFDEVLTENAEQIHNILPDSIKPNRVIMNPPFSSTAGRIQGERNTKNATLHVDQALKRLEPGGRAVMILGKGMADDAPAFKAWWNAIRKEYNVRANIELSGKDYRKYGTSFGNVLAVIDKTGPTPAGGTVTGKYESVLDALEALEKVRNDYASVATEKAGAERVAWHGSTNHNIDKLSLSTFGTGDGNSAWGYGIYLAADESTARWYIGDDEKGKVYKTTLPDDDLMLDYGKTMEMQPPHVRAALKSKINDGNLRKTGWDFYEGLIKELGEDRDASEYLASVGIPGARYLEAPIEEGAKRTLEYIIYDENAIEIVPEEKEKGETPPRTSETVSAKNRADDASLLQSPETSEEGAGDVTNSVASENSEIKLPPEENVRRGREAMERVIAEKTDAIDAMHRDDVGSISFVYGIAKKATVDGQKKKPHGIAHIIDKHGLKAAHKMVDVLAHGEIVKEYDRNLPGQKRVDIAYDGYEAHLALYKDGKRMTWVITGYEKYKSPDASGEVSGSTGATLPKPIPRGVREGAGDVADSVASENSEIKQKTPAKEQKIDVERKSKAERAADRAAKVKPEEDNAVYDDYAPAKLKIKGAKPHPADLVQSAAMAAVEPPEPTYSPRLPKEIVESGKLSEAQLEAVTYAGQSFEQKNPDGTRRGFFIGDGTGVGKGREISGILTDQMAQGYGKGKAVWVSMNAGLLKDAQRDWEGVGNNPDDIFSHQKVNAKESIRSKFEKGIAFTAYSTLRSDERLKQLQDWLGKDFDGVIALDEAHNANNAMDVKMERGVKGASKQALAVQDLVAAFPEARVLYVSATGATEVRNLAMLDRLGLWGEGTAFPNKLAFVSSIEKGGTAAMELVARDMKAMGRYIARSISYRAGKHGGDENVTFRRLEHPLNEHQLPVYDRIAEAWQSVLSNMDKALELIVGEENAKSGRVRGQALGQFWSSHQRALNQIITSMQTPSVVNAIKKDLAEGKSVVIQLTNTNEADQKRALERLEEGDTLDDLDLTPKDALLNFLKHSFPVNQYQEVADEDGNKRLVAVLDSKGAPVLNREAVRIRDDLVRDVASIAFPDSPMDMIINAFGADAVAEITGRGERVVTRDGKKVREKRPRAAREADKLAFQNGDKRILIFSEAGGTGASYHADRAAKNQEKRVHYLLQPGWRADAAIQGLGRTHRSNEAHKPEYVLVTTDLPGQKRFISTIARRLEQLGALTTGERKSATQGLFSERDNLESPHAQMALNRLFERIVWNGVGGYSSTTLLKQLGFSNLIDPDTRRMNKTAMPKIPQFLNRLLSLKYDAQQKVFAEFEGLLDQEIKNAMARGELDVGTETLRADSIEVLQEKVVHKDEARGFETKYVELETSHRQQPIFFSAVKDQAFYISKRTGNVLAARETKASVTNAETGEIEKQFLLTGVDPAYKGKSTEKALTNEAYYTPIAAQEAKKKWTGESTSFPEFRTEKKHLITGALLPIWDRLDGHPRIMRVTTKDGQTFLGRLIEPEKLLHTLRSLGTEYSGKAVPAGDVLKEIEKPGAVAVLANGWKIRRARVNGENRIELVGPDFTYRRMLTEKGLFSESIQWKERWFIPTGDESKVEAVLKISPVVETRKADLIGDAAQAVNAGTEDFNANDYGGMSVKFVDGGRPNPFTHTAEDSGPASPGFRFEDEKTETRYQAARAGVKRAGALQRIGEFLKEFRDGLKSDFPELAGKPFDFAREALRRMNRRRNVAMGDAILTLRKTVKEMNPQEYDLFSRKRILDDLMVQKNEMPDSALPYGFTDEQLEREHKRVTAEAGKSEKIQDAIEWEERVVGEINKNMVRAADAIGWHSLSKKFTNPHYFRHVVLEYANAAANGRKAGLRAPENRGYMKKRQGSEKDISAHYIQAMGEVRSLQLQDIETMKALKELKDEYNIAERLKRAAFVENESQYMAGLFAFAKGRGMNDLVAGEWVDKQMGELNKKQAIALSRLFDMAKRGNLPEGKFSGLVREMTEAGTVEDLSDTGRKQLNSYLSWLAGLGDDPETIAARTYFKGVAEKKREIKDTLGERHLTWRDLIPDGHVEWHPFQNRLVYSVNTVAEELVKEVLDAGLDELNIPVDALEKMFVMGGHRQTWVIPQELADTLDRLGKPTERTALGNAAKEITTQWKEWVLHSPMRVFRYNARNITGDADAVLAGNPDAFRFVGQAFKDLANVYVKGQAATGELAEYTKRGGSVGAQHIQDLGDMTSVREFQQLLSLGEKGLMRLPKKYWRTYWSGARNVSDFREGLLRYATYLSYLDQMQKNAEGHPKNWGASKRGEVLANRDVRDRAFKMANELLGAYDQVSESGRNLRDIMMPFYSWMEVNMRRYAQIFRNGMEDGDIGDVVKRTVMGQALKTPVYAWRVGKTAFKVSLFWALVQAFNRLMHGDEEDDLPPDVQGRPHITLGRDASGNVVYFDRLGSFADCLDWFALDSAYTDIRDILNGHQTLGDYAKKMAQAPASKLINALTPLLKVPVEAISGKQFYPDAFNSRSIRDLGMYLAGTVGLTPEFVALTGRPSPGYLKSRGSSAFTYSLDPEEASYWWILDKKRQFQENVLGTSWSGFSTSERGASLANIKKAIRYGDRKAFVRYVQEYAKFDGTPGGLVRSIESMKPMAGLSNENKVRFYQWLSAQDRKYLPRAMSYYTSLLSSFGK